MNPDLSSLTLSAAIEHLRQREYSAQDLTQACLARINRLNPEINAFITITPELAFQSARQADLIFAHGPSNQHDLALLGSPVGIKDLIDVAGVVTTAGSKFFSGVTPADDAAAVLDLKLAGAVILGKTNTHEIALGVTGVNPHFGAVRNPWDLSRITGGSSSGSAAAVAAGMCLAGLGTDTGGSVRIPAALCGVVGLKPTFGRVSLRGVMPLSWNLDHVGVLTRIVRDAALVLSTLAKFDPHDPVSVNIPADDYLGSLEKGIKGWRIALAWGDYFESSDLEVLASIKEAALVFRDLGGQVENVDLAWLAELAAANGLVTQVDAAAFHHERMTNHPDWFGEDVRQRLHNGAGRTALEYALARRKQAEGRRRFEIFFEKYDILLLPTTPIPAPPIDNIDSLSAANNLTRFTNSFNLTGLPALSVPCGFTKAGLPLGLQIISKHWAEARVLQAACAYEQATAWHDCHPSFGY